LAMMFYCVTHVGYCVWFPQQEYNTFWLWIRVIIGVLMIFLPGDLGMRAIAVYAAYHWVLTLKYLFWMLYKCCCWAVDMDLDAEVTNLYHMFPTFPFHLLSALIVLFLQAMLAEVVWLLDRAKWPKLGALRWHTTWLFGKHFKPNNVDTIWPLHGEQSPDTVLPSPPTDTTMLPLTGRPEMTPPEIIPPEIIHPEMTSPEMTPQMKLTGRTSPGADGEAQNGADSSPESHQFDTECCGSQASTPTTTSP